MQSYIEKVAQYLAANSGCLHLWKTTETVKNAHICAINLCRICFHYTRLVSLGKPFLSMKKILYVQSQIYYDFDWLISLNIFQIIFSRIDQAAHFAAFGHQATGVGDTGAYNFTYLLI